MIKVLTIFVSFIFAVTFFTALDGLVLLAYWEWFIMPLGVSKINIFYAIALAALIKHFACGYQSAKQGEDRVDKALDFLMMKPLLAFGFACFIYFLMHLIPL